MIIRELTLCCSTFLVVGSSAAFLLWVTLWTNLSLKYQNDMKNVFYFLWNTCLLARIALISPIKPAPPPPPDAGAGAGLGSWAPPPSSTYTQTEHQS